MALTSEQWLQMFQSGQEPADEAQRSEGAMLANQMFAADPGVSSRLSADQIQSLMPWLTASSGGNAPGMYFSGPNTAPTAEASIHAPGPSVPEVNYPPPQHSDPMPPTFSPSYGPSNPPGFPEAKPPTQQKLDEVFTAPNSSSSFPAAQMPTFANNPAPVASNAIPYGDIPGRTAQGLLSTRQNPSGYIQGLLGQFNPSGWQGGMADVLSRSVPQATPLLDKRRGGNPATPTTGATPTDTAATTTVAYNPSTASGGPFAPAPPAEGAGPDGAPWNLTNGGVIIGYRRDYSPVFGPPGSTPSQAFV